MERDGATGTTVRLHLRRWTVGGADGGLAGTTVPMKTVGPTPLGRGGSVCGVNRTRGGAQRGVPWLLWDSRSERRSTGDQ